MDDESQKLRQEVAELAQRIEVQETALAASNGAFVLLARYLAEGGQVYLQELADDLDVLCQAQPDPVWQRSLILLAEQLRSCDERLQKAGR